MRFVRIFLGLVFIFISGLQVYAQVSNIRIKKIAASGVQKIDSLSIVPGSFLIKNTDSSFFKINYADATIIWLKRPAFDSIDVLYRTFQFNFHKKYYRYNFDSIVGNFIAAPVIIRKKNEYGEGIINFGNLNYHGSIGRSLSFGNAQDAVFNSDLNLQLNGFIGDSIELNAAITDNNIPIQPDGTTQQLNEFDKILLQFKKSNWELNLGDIDLRTNEQYFLKFYKRLQGIHYTRSWQSGLLKNNKTTVSGALAKGKFTRNIFQGQEGNQGPYRLEGANRELFFIVLSGTEKVYMDGVLLQRGQDRDYVIDYNTAEITFTPKQMVTKDSRIQVEFEYADRNFLNTQVYVHQQSQIGKNLKIGVGYYNNSDAKNSPINQNLNDKQKQFLADLGNNINDAFYEQFNIDSFSATKILYKRIDTVYVGGQDSIFVYSTSPDSARYSLNFVFVGENKGHYKPLFNAANGKVFQWVQPVNGIMQGSYEPAVFLVTPKQHQVASINAEYSVTSKTIFQTDLAFSNYNLNKFSSKNKNDDVGYGAKFQIFHNNHVTAFNKTYQLSSMAGYEYVSQNFKPVERLRAVEFARDWGLSPLSVSTNEHLPSLAIKIQDGKENFLAYKSEGYFRGDHYNANRHTLQHHHQLGEWTIDDMMNITFIKGGSEKGHFFRPSFQIAKKFLSLNNIVAGSGFSLEQKKIINISGDSLSKESFQFRNISFFIRSDQSKMNKWSVSYTNREDAYSSAKSMVPADVSHNYHFETELMKSMRHQFKINVTYRELFIKRFDLSKQKPENSLLSRVEYFFNEWNGFLKGSSLYELGAGQEPKREFSYIEVPPGKGEYAWIDYNGDGIPQLNEFEIAQFPDEARYIKIFTPSNEFIKSAYTQFNYNFTLTPQALFKEIPGAGKPFITRFIFQSSLQSGKKEISDNAAVFNPFKTELSDTALININTIFSNTISYNRFSSIWGLDITNLNNRSKTLLTYGIEARKLENWIIRARVNFKKAYTLEWIQRINNQNLFTPAFEERNYEIHSIHSEPRISYTYLTKFRVTAAYNFIKKRNALRYGGESMMNHVIRLESKFNAVQSTSVNGMISLNNISYSGKTNSPVSYVLLDGLQPGKNILWNLEFNRRILSNLEISFQYEGRKPANGAAIHIGRAAIRAIL